MLSMDFFRRSDVVRISRELLGNYLFSTIDGIVCGGIITETEAYCGVEDRASHAFGGRRTNRTEVMYAEGGHIYVYLCYGIHQLFNIVTHREGIPHAILIRAIHPTHGLDTIMKRRKKKSLEKGICSGPGKLTQALKIEARHSGRLLDEQWIWVEETKEKADPLKIKATPRIGVDYAGKDALLPYRFVLSV